MIIFQWTGHRHVAGAAGERGGQRGLVLVIRLLLFLFLLCCCPAASAGAGAAAAARLLLLPLLLLACLLKSTGHPTITPAALPSPFTLTGWSVG